MNVCVCYCIREECVCVLILRKEQTSVKGGRWFAVVPYSRLFSRGRLLGGCSSAMKRFINA